MLEQSPQSLKCLTGTLLFFLGVSKGPEDALRQMAASQSIRECGKPVAAVAHRICFHRVATHCLLNMLQNISSVVGLNSNSCPKTYSLTFSCQPQKILFYIGPHFPLETSHPLPLNRTHFLVKNNLC